MPGVSTTGAICAFTVVVFAAVIVTCCVYSEYSLPRDTAINLPDFVVALDRAGCALRAYVHDGYWLDIGRHADYEQACRDVERLVLW